MIKDSNKNKNSEPSYGLRLYYVNDYENTPLIIIDPQRFGNPRGIGYYEMIIETFRFVFFFYYWLY